MIREFFDKDLIKKLIFVNSYIYFFAVKFILSQLRFATATFT